MHEELASQFFQKTESYEDRTIRKGLSTENISFIMVEMEHRVLPRFLDGL